MRNPNLLSLSVKGLGVIEDSLLEFDDGFTVITGETGAGKTLLVDALTLCLGGDARSPRRGEEMVVTSVFESADGQEVALQRSLSSGSRLKASHNGVPTSSEALRTIGRDLLALHGQHDSLKLRSRSDVLELIDSFGSIDTKPLASLSASVQKYTAEQRALGGSEAEREKESDFLRYQLDEIESAKIKCADELTKTLEELEELTEMREQSGAIGALLEVADGDNGSLLDSLSHAVTTLSTTGRVGESRSQLLSLISDIRSGLRELRDAADDFEADEARLNELNSRAELLRNLERKFGGSLESVLAERDRLGERLAFLQTAAERSAAIGDELAEAITALARESARIRTLRTTAANRLTHLVQEQFARVALPNAQMAITIDGDDGSLIDIQFRPNPGAAAGSLQSIASGGELSRILLAMSLVTASDGLVTVFDEIDAGVGGNVAQSIGECLADLSRSRQVIAVTHLASVAAKARHHFVVEKLVANGVTTTTVRRLTAEERPEEIARMLAGDGASAEALALARQLLG